MALPQPAPEPDPRPTSGPNQTQPSAPKRPRTGGADPAVVAMLYESMLERPVRKRSTALLLCLFLGAFGTHRFYVGKTGSGSTVQ